VLPADPGLRPHEGRPVRRHADHGHRRRPVAARGPAEAFRTRLELGGGQLVGRDRRPVDEVRDPDAGGEERVGLVRPKASVGAARRGEASATSGCPVGRSGGRSRRTHRLGGIPQNRTRRLGATTSGIAQSLAASRSARVGRINRSSRRARRAGASGRPAGRRRGRAARPPASRPARRDGRRASPMADVRGPEEALRGRRDERLLDERGRRAPEPDPVVVVVVGQGHEQALVGERRRLPWLSRSVAPGRAKHRRRSRSTASVTAPL